MHLLDLHSRFDRVVGPVVDLNDPNLFTEFVIVVWGVWKFRNLKVFQHNEVLVCDVVINCFLC